MKNTSIIYRWYLKVDVAVEIVSRTHMIAGYKCVANRMTSLAVSNLF